MDKQGLTYNMRMFDIQKSLNKEPHTYKHIKLIGQGTFGKVYKSVVEQT
jgi:serine/threonine protein kinase